MRYKPERALTLYVREVHTFDHIYSVEMRYKPERALTPDFASVIFTGLFGRNEV